MKPAVPIFAALAVLGIAAISAASVFIFRSQSIVRIGVNHSPPYAIIDADGAVTGFSPEVLTEAARRSRMKIQWVIAPEGPEAALKSGKVDVWHLLTDLPERHKFAHMTDPWLRMRYVLVVPEHGSIRGLDDAVGRRISHTRNLLQLRLVHQYFSQSTLVPQAMGTELAAVCRGEADAAFIDVKGMIAQLLHRMPGCESLAFDLIPIKGASFQMVIAATGAGFPAARKLRAEINNMAEDKSLDLLYGKWLRDTSDETTIVTELTQARQRFTLLRYEAAILAAVVILLAILMYCQRTVRQALRSAYEFASAVLDTAGGLVFISDRHGRIVRFNRACERVTGKTFQEVRNRTSWEIFVPSEEQPAVQAMFAQLAGGVARTNHEHHWTTSEGPRLFSWSNTILLNNIGKVDYIIATGIDISHREATEQKLGYEATHDSLTNLVNRRQFLRELDVALVEARSGGGSFSLVLADLDHFKIVNDTYGHEAGDEVLTYLARLLRSELAPSDLAGRLGGDEFCLLIRSVGVASILQRISTYLADHEFRSASGESFRAAVTFGLATWSDSICDSAILLRAADQALYVAKNRSPARSARFESDFALLGAELAADRDRHNSEVLTRGKGDLHP